MENLRKYSRFVRAFRRVHQWIQFVFDAKFCDQKICLLRHKFFLIGIRFCYFRFFISRFWGCQWVFATEDWLQKILQIWVFVVGQHFPKLCLQPRIIVRSSEPFTFSKKIYSIIVRSSEPFTFSKEHSMQNFLERSVKVLSYKFFYGFYKGIFFYGFHTCLEMSPAYILQYTTYSL